MKKYSLPLSAALFLTAGLGLAHAQGTGFTYQGRLNTNGAAVTGNYDFSFVLYAGPSGGSGLASLAAVNVPVVNGLFTVTNDFGPVFSGTAAWLEIGVRTNGATTFTTLTTRQEVTPTPYAIYAEKASAAGLSGLVPVSSLPANVALTGTSNVFSMSQVVDGTFTVNGTLTLPANNGTIFSGSGLLFHYDVNGNFFAGLNAGSTNLTGQANTGVGLASLSLLTNGSWNTSVGAGALWFDTAGSYNTAVGYGALLEDSLASNNVAIGYDALFESSTGGGNVAVGSQTLGANRSGYNNTALGYEVLTVADSFDNVGIGCSTFEYLTGYQNTGVGTYSFQNLSAGAGNIGLGYSAGKNLTTGTNNIYVGSLGGANENGIIRIGTQGTQSTTALVGKVGINTDSPSVALEVNGGYMMVDGLGGVQAYVGDDGHGGDVQVGSMKSGVTSVTLYNSTDLAPMHLNCSSITIQGGSDLAEPFPISASQEVTEGSVLIIDEQNPGHLKMSDGAYDTRVAGVVSGANGVHPGIQMHQLDLLEGGKDVALTGRVYVRADAGFGPIHPGDLLTTSPVAGRAMRVGDHSRAQGAILGKAMTGLATGQGMVLVLVTLQ